MTMMMFSKFFNKNKKTEIDSTEKEVLKEASEVSNKKKAESLERKILPSTIWDVHSYIISGASHKKKGIEKQDAIAMYESSTLLIAGVSDGHGSNKSSLSSIGANLCVDAFVEVAIHFFSNSEKR